MLVLVVGPSGAGKDTLISGAKAALAGDARFLFPRRIVTREAVASLEDHDSVTPTEFALQEANGAYALSWEAHGLCYGLPARIAEDIAAGRVVVMNASRAMVAAAEAKFPGTIAVVIDANPTVRARRLAGRGRETADEIEDRLAREVSAPLPSAIRIDNSGDVDEGVARFLAVLRGFAGI